MKKWAALIILIFFNYSLCSKASAANLIEVYRQAVVSDQTFLQIVSQQWANKENVQINTAAILPNLTGLITPSLIKTDINGIAPITASNTVKGYSLNLTLTQTVFNLSQFANISQSVSLSKQSDAIITSAAQDLILRVAKAYFAILQDEDNLKFIAASKEAYAKQLDQVNQQYKVGLKTITDVYTARASYDSSVASFIAAETRLADDKENLRVITGIFYPSIWKLSENYPLTTPKPANSDAWVNIAEQQNWNIKAAQYAACAACTNVKKQFSGHIPTLQVQGILNNSFTRTIAKEGEIQTLQVSGPARARESGGSLILNVPLVQGGLVIANTHQAQYNYQASYHNLEQQVRNTINQARQSYLGVISGMRQVQADKLTITSTISSLEGLQAGYQVGTQTLVDVINQQQNVVRAQFQYAADRYAYIINLLTLKYAAGTLSPCDLEIINTWLYPDSERYTEDQSTFEGKMPSYNPDTDGKIDNKMSAHSRKRKTHYAMKSTKNVGS